MKQVLLGAVTASRGVWIAVNDCAGVLAHLSKVITIADHHGVFSNSIWLDPGHEPDPSTSRSGLVR